MNWDGPHCPSWTGGVAATSTKVAKHRQGADGVVVQMFCSSLNNHPVCADSGCFAIFSFWHSHPSWPGGVMGLIAIHSQLHRPPLQSGWHFGYTPNRCIAFVVLFLTYDVDPRTSFLACRTTGSRCRRQHFRY